MLNDAALASHYTILILGNTKEASYKTALLQKLVPTFDVSFLEEGRIRLSQPNFQACMFREGHARRFTTWRLRQRPTTPFRLCYRNKSRELDLDCDIFNEGHGGNEP